MKVNLDKYYTNSNAILLCYQYIKNKLNINKNDLLIEPSAGNGSFINIIKQLSDNYIFYDIQPDNTEIIEQNFLLLDIKQFEKKYNKIHIIGNPPFGRQLSLAIKFIKKSCEFCDSFCFILPKSFKKQSMIRTIPINFHLIFENDLPKNSFLVDDKPYNVHCVFQIWIKKSYNRDIVMKQTSKYFKFVKKEDNPDVSVQRVGSKSGYIKEDIANCNINTHYFIKISNKYDKNKIIKLLNNNKYNTFNNTLGQLSISKDELINHYNHLLL